MGFNTHGPLTTDMTKQLCHFIKTLQYEDIPPAVIERAKMMVMHTCGVSLCSSELKQIKDAIEISKEMSPGNQGTATLWADGKKVSWEAAAFTAGTMGDWSGLGGLFCDWPSLRRCDPCGGHRYGSAPQKRQGSVDCRGGRL